MASKKLVNKLTERETWLWFIAGPNGAGKSTWVSSLAPKKLLGSIPILNPDVIHDDENSLKSFVFKGRKTLETLRSCVSSHKSFAVETTLSGQHYLAKAKSLKKKGWNVGCIYIGLNSVEQSIARVEERVRNGGHDVPIKDIIRRYPRSLQNLSRMIKICDYLAVFDNSFELELLMEADLRGVYIRKHSIPLWLKETLNQVL